VTKTWNHLYNLFFGLVALLAALPREVLDVLPAAWKPGLVAASVIALYIKSHWNLWVNPDGTPAQTPYMPPRP
jgi:hypothetical protein